jgi:3-deoxy-D-manno-octulosonic-acid transferase
MLVLVETEIWPNAIRHARLHHIPVVVANGRISDRHYTRYLRYRRFVRPVLEQLNGVCVQNQTYAERFEALGAPSARIEVTGNTKFDGLTTFVEHDRLTALRQESGLDREGPTIIFGSTRPGDEALAAASWRELRGSFPSARLVVAPRHIERVPEVLSHFDEPVRLRSAGRAGNPGARVVVVDTLGELVTFYALADVAVVGGSFYPGVNGHNPLEPAALGTPVIFGPYMRNFMDPAEALVRHGGAIQLPGPESLTATLNRLLTNPSETTAIVEGARHAIAANQGATERTLDFLGEILGAHGG